MDKKQSLLRELLLALIPYTKQNTKLVLRPAQFFRELESRSNYNFKSIETTYYRAKHKGLIEVKNNKVNLSSQAREYIQPFVAKKLKGDVFLMVIFDIPEKFRNKRGRFRQYLKLLDFKQVQKSVWVSKMDYRAQIIEAISELKLSSYVLFYESVNISLYE